MLDQCQTCLEQLRAEREIADQIAALPAHEPGGRIRRPSHGVGSRTRSLRHSLAPGHPPPPFRHPEVLALAASLALLLVGSMAGSIIWSLATRRPSPSIGSWLLAQGGQAAWLGPPRPGLQLHRAALVQRVRGPWWRIPAAWRWSRR